jgi:hypothetical protein
MSDLEELIRDVVKRGELTYLSLAPRQIRISEKQTVPGWGASFSPASTTGNTFAEDRDPIVALKACIEEAKLRRKPEFQDGEGAKPAAPEKLKPKPKPRASAPQTDLSDIGL